VLQCRKEEANIDHAALSNGFHKGMEEYCTPDFAYRLGRQAELLSNDMCSDSMLIKMKQRHAEGVKDYCQPSNGEPAGASGKKYNQICPREMETAFLPEFNKGRKKYLTGLIARRESEIHDLERDVTNLERRKDDLRHDLRRAEGEKAIAQALTPSDKSRLLVDTIERRIRDIRSDLHRVERDISGKQSRQQSLREEMRTAQGELPTL
jgi:predicted  nucleic acid-binding Zn-ribbon protein